MSLQKWDLSWCSHSFLPLIKATLCEDEAECSSVPFACPHVHHSKAVHHGRQTLMSLSRSGVTWWVTLVLCLQTRLEAQKKAEQEKRRREMVRLDFWNLRKGSQRCWQIKTDNNSCRNYPEGRWWVSHTWWSLQSWGRYCRRQEVIQFTVPYFKYAKVSTLLQYTVWWLVVDLQPPLSLQSGGSCTPILWLCFRRPTSRKKLSSSCPSTSTTTPSIAMYRSTSGYDKSCSVTIPKNISKFLSVNNCCASTKFQNSFIAPRNQSLGCWWRP